MNRTLEYQIEDGIPLPKRGAGIVRNPIARVALALEVGQSFLVKDDSRASVARISVTLTQLHRKHPGHRFTQRKVDGGMRVWRLA